MFRALSLIAAGAAVVAVRRGAEDASAAELGAVRRREGVAERGRELTAERRPETAARSRIRASFSTGAAVIDR